MRVNHIYRYILGSKIILFNHSRFMMINLEKRRVISSMIPHFGSFQDESGAESKEKLSIDRNIHILRSFFRSVVGPIFPDIFIANPYGIDQSTGGNITNFLTSYIYP